MHRPSASFGRARVQPDQIRAAFAKVGVRASPQLPPEDDYEAPSEYPPSADGEPVLEPLNGAGATTEPEPALLPPIPPAAWRGTPLPPMRWLALHRIPAGDVTILSGDGGGGKTTIALQLAAAVAGELGDWLGTVCSTGPAIFFSGEEPEAEMRRRWDSIARRRGLE